MQNKTTTEVQLDGEELQILADIRQIRNDLATLQQLVQAKQELVQMKELFLNNHLRLRNNGFAGQVSVDAVRGVAVLISEHEE